MIYDVIVVGGGIAAVEAVRQFTAKDYEEGLRYSFEIKRKVIIFDKAEVSIRVW